MDNDEEQLLPDDDELVQWQQDNELDEGLDETVSSSSDDEFHDAQQAPENAVLPIFVGQGNPVLNPPWLEPEPAAYQALRVAQPQEAPADSPPRRRSFLNRLRNRSGVNRANSVPFNQSLPAAHLYLGSEMEELPGGQVMYEAGTILEDVILFPLTHLILMPGQTLPLQYLHPRSVAMFRRIMSDWRIFGAITRKSNDEFNKYGTIAQVVAFYEHQEPTLDSLKIRAIGRQRFQLLDYRRQLDGTHCSRVKILADHLPQGIARYAALPSLEPYARLRRNRGSRRLERLAHFGRHLLAVPGVALKYYDTDELISRLVSELSEWYDQSKVEAMGASSPIHLSYWIAATLPIDDGENMSLFSMDSALQRLRAELSILLRCTKFCCSNCGAVIGEKADVFTMSVEGPTSAYVNPNGVIHETMTLRRASNVEMVGQQTTLHSWFPGYAWRILQCAMCHGHLGWRFKAVAATEPRKFWGITRTAIKPLMVRLGDEEDDVPAVVNV